MSSNSDFVIEGGVLKQYAGPGGDVVIPEDVTEIGYDAFRGCTGPTSVTIPDCVKNIGDFAFSGCKRLTSIEIAPKNKWFYVENNVVISKRRKSVIFAAKGLTSVTIPEGVKEIGSSAFSGCTGLTGVTIPEGVKEIDRSTFSHCTSLTSVTIPEGVKEIGDSAFRGCTGLTGVTIPEGAKIGGWAFHGCEHLTIHAPAGSYAQQYAEEHHIPFAAE